MVSEKAQLEIKEIAVKYKRIIYNLVMGIVDLGADEVRRKLSDIMDELNKKIMEIVEKYKQQALIDYHSKIDITKMTKQELEEELEELEGHLERSRAISDDLERRLVGDILMFSSFGSLVMFRKRVKKTLRLDRDDIIGEFSKSIKEVMEQYLGGKITNWNERMLGVIQHYYEEAYRKGKGSDVLSALEKKLIDQQVKGQIPYLSNFEQNLTREKPLKMYARANLYAQRGTALYEMGHLSSLDDDVLIDWILGYAEHCDDCIMLSRNSPYTKMTLPSIPGLGDTMCLVNCQCKLEERVRSIRKTESMESFMSVYLMRDRDYGDKKVYKKS